MNTDSPQKTHNPLLSSCEHCFSMVAPLKDDKKAAAVPEDFREHVLDAFVAMEKAAFEQQIGMVEFRDAKYAMAAYIDEVVLGSNWPGRGAWMSRPLQLEFFGNHTAGEGFFTRLANLRQGGEENLYMLELYYYCLQLGFEGIYKIKGLEHLMALQVDVRSQIDGYRGPAKKQICSEGLPGHVLLSRVRRHTPYWVIAVVTVAAVFFTYMGYAYVSGKAATASVTTLLENKETLLKLDRDDK